MHCARCERRAQVVERELPLCGNCFLALSMTKLRVPKRRAQQQQQQKEAA